VSPPVLSCFSGNASIVNMVLVVSCARRALLWLYGGLSTSCCSRRWRRPPARPPWGRRLLRTQFVPIGQGMFLVGILVANSPACNWEAVSKVSKVKHVQARPPGRHAAHQACTASGGPVGGSGTPGLLILVVLNPYRARLKIVMNRVHSSHVQSVVRSV